MPPPPPPRLAPPPPSTALTPLPVPLKPPRRRARPTRLHPRRRRAPPAPRDDLAALAALSDTQVALDALHAQWPRDACAALPRTPPLLLRSQLHALVADRAEVARETARLVAARRLRPVRLPGGAPAFVRESDYAPPGLRAVCRAAREAWVRADDVRAAVADDGLSDLVRAGFLTLRDEHSFWFAVPGMAQFVRHRDTGTRQILALLRRAPYREMPLATLEARTLTDTCFTARWHVRDVVGAGLAESVDTSVGVLVRLPR